MMLLSLCLVLLLLGCVYVIYNLYNKYNALEVVAKENVDFIMSMRTRVLSQQSYLKQLDRKGAFESDDEIGYFFKELKKMINDIAFYLDVEQEDQDESEPKIGGTVERF